MIREEGKRSWSSTDEAGRAEAGLARRSSPAKVTRSNAAEADCARSRSPRRESTLPSRRHGLMMRTHGR